MNKCLVVLAGPTAAGKTDLGVWLAQQWQIPVISADSRQFYKEMSIGTAKPTPAEMQGVPHYFIDSLSVHAPYSAGHFEREVLELLDTLFLQHHFVLMVGGSGLFIQAVCEGMDELPELPEGLREQVMEEFARGGLEPLLAELAQKDPIYYEQVDKANYARVIRAIEVIRSTGQPFSSLRKKEAAPRPFQTIKIVVTPPRDLLYARVNRRVDLMMQAGLLEEARGLFHLRHLNALQTVGYQEFFEHFEGHTTLEEAVELLKRNTRRYAKKQLTWFRRDVPAEAWFEPQQREEIKAFAENALREVGCFEGH
jgi:tRNA dimethylallyltransferase